MPKKDHGPGVQSVRPFLQVVKTILSAFVVFAPQAASLMAAVQTAGARWTSESSFEAAKGEVGLDHSEVRSWTGWYRHVTLAMRAYTLLTVVRARHLQEGAVPKKMWCPTSSTSLAACKAARNRGSR
jgi:SRSO17 transposase